MTETATPSTARATRPFNSWDALKLLGMLTMFIDHAGVFFFPDLPLLRALGRPTIPIFLFLTGYAVSHRVTVPLIATAVALVLVNSYVTGGISTLNILFTIIAGRLLLQQVEKGRLPIRKPLEWLCVLVLLLPSVVLFQTGTLGLTFVIAGYLHRHRDRYSLRTRAWFFALAFAVYAVVDGYALHLPLLDRLFMYVIMIATARLLWKMEIRPLRLTRPLDAFTPALALGARNMLWIYAAHFAALQLFTGIGY